MPLLDIDPLTGAVEHFHYDHDSKRSVITRTRNVDTTLDLNTWALNNSDKTWKGRDLWHVASVPEDLVWAWMLEFNEPRSLDERLTSPFDKNADWERFQWARLNSGEFRKLRTAPVVV